jgi:hypothetical protein
MNEINSVIVEGVVSVGLKAISDYEGTFTVTTHRYYKVGEEKKCEETSVHVIVSDVFFKRISKNIEGRGIRVVGRLCNYMGGLSLFAECLEFKGGAIKSGKYTFKL